MRISDWSSDVCSSDLATSSLYCAPLFRGRPSCSIRYVLLSSVMTSPLVTLLVHAHSICSGDAKLAAAQDEYFRDRRVLAIAPNVQKRPNGPCLRLRGNLTHTHRNTPYPVVAPAVFAHDNKGVAVVVD